MVAEYVILRVQYFTSLRHSSANWVRRSDNTDVIRLALSPRAERSGANMRTRLGGIATNPEILLHAFDEHLGFDKFGKIPTARPAMSAVL